MHIFRNFSIKNKLIFLVVVISMASIVIGFFGIIVGNIIQLRKDLVSSTVLDTALVGEYCIGPLEFGDKQSVNEMLKKLKAVPIIEKAWVYNEEEELYGFYSRKPGKNIDTPNAPQTRFSKFIGEHLHVGMPIIYKQMKFGSIYLMASTQSLNETTRNRVILMLLVMAFSILISYILAIKFQRIISAPILKLARVTEDVSRDINYSIRVRRSHKDEIGTLYNGFNNMLEKIQLWEKKRDEAEAEQQRLMVELEAKNKELEQVVYVTSHDLRSPLVNIQGFGQELSYAIQEVEQYIIQATIEPLETKNQIFQLLSSDIMESLKFIQSSTNKMDALLSGLLRLSRVGRMTTTFEKIDMNRLIKEVADAFEFQLKEADGTLTIESMPPCFGCELEISQVFSNLLGNAIKYRHPDRPLEIKIYGHPSEDKKQIVYFVQDNGTGIPIEYQKKIFHIFHRLKPDETEGEGLGLAIVHKIVQRHNGTVGVISEEGSGSRFIITLPPIVETIESKTPVETHHR